MKRKIFAVTFFVFFTEFFFRSNLVFSQNASDISQTLVPLEVYVGDVAEIRYSFTLDSGIFSGQNIEKEIDVEEIPFGKLADALTIKAARFSMRENDCSLVIQFIPWRTGAIDFPAFDLLSVLDLEDVAKDEKFFF